MSNENATMQQREDNSMVGLDDLERLLQEQLGDELSDIDTIQEQLEGIGEPNALGEVLLDTVWEQFTNQIAITAGEDFIKDNNGLHLDLRDEAHIQTAENFADGKIASHNTEIDYQQRYDEWQANFEKDANGDTVTYTDRTGKEKAKLTKDARKPFDADRPKGNAEKKTDMDHTISAAEIIRDPEANAFMTKEEQVAFANSDANLNEIDSAMNRSKKDMAMEEWLDTPNANGQKPSEIFDNLDEQTEEQLRQKDAEARAEYEKQKKEAEQKNIEAGKKSQKAEALRVGKKAARAIIMNLLAQLVKKIAQKFVHWLRSKEKSFKSLIASIKEAIIAFVIDLKNNVVNVADTAITVIATSILGPVVNVIKKAWMFIKQGWSSLKQSIEYIKDPANKGKSRSIMMLEIGKIITAGLTAAGSIVLSEVIEMGLMQIPIFAFEIPLFGSLANIIGMFVGAVAAGIIGALAINLLNNLIAKKQKAELLRDRVDKGNEVLSTQKKIIDLNEVKLETIKSGVSEEIKERHEEAAEIMRESIENVLSNNSESNDTEFRKINQRLDVLTEGGQE